MSYHIFYKRVENTAGRLFPGLAQIVAPAWDHLVSPLELRLPKSIYQNAAAAIRALHALSRRPAYSASLEPVPGISDVETRNESLLMAYDFHSSESGECRLIEVNTNASGYMLSSLMQMAHADNPTLEWPSLQSLRQVFIQELSAFGKDPSRATIAITDEEIPQQKMYAEFLMYRDWLRSAGWKTDFCEARDFQADGGVLSSPQFGPVDLVYNRLTDFYLENAQFAALRAGYMGQLACLSPNPREYWLLADKQRLIQLSQPDFLQRAQATPEEIESLKRVLIPTFEKSDFASREEIWAQRRHLFFKPKRSYGGKSVYRGESVSRKVFERLMHEEILIQHFYPAQKMPTEDPRSVLNNWKFDLRFYVYRDQIQLVVARIYQGQVTNFSSPLGGFTLVQFE